MPAEIIDIDKNSPYEVSEVICINCKTRFVSCRPAGVELKLMECYNCRQLGFIIETGEQYENIADQERHEYIRKPIADKGLNIDCKV